MSPSRRAAALAAASELLCRGAVLLKFGRRGRPHRRFVWLDGARLRWRSAKLGDLAATPGFIDLSSSSRVVQGASTAVFSRQLDRVGTQTAACLSVVGGGRTLDLLAASPEQCNRWAAALRLVLTEL